MEKLVNLKRLSIILSRFVLICFIFLPIGKLPNIAHASSILSLDHPVGHFTTSVVAYPVVVANGGTLFMKGQDLYISEDGGHLWDVVTFSEPNIYPPASYNVVFVTASPDYQNDGTAIVLVGGPYYIHLGITRDFGKSWTLSGGGDFVSLDKVVFSPDYKVDHTLYASSPLQKSIDGGLTWERVTIPAPTTISILCISPNYSQDHEIIITGNFIDHKVIKSNDDSHWYPADNGLFTDAQSVVNMAFVKDGLSTNGHPILLASNGMSLKISENDGDLWTTLSNIKTPRFTASKNPASGKLEIFAFDLITSKYIYTLDSGITWTSFLEGPYLNELDLSELELSPGYQSDGTIFGYNYSGIWKSSDKGLNWQKIIPRLGSDYYGEMEFLISPTFELDRTVIAYSRIKPNSFDPTPTSWLKSIDGGRNWTQMSLPFTLNTGTLWRMAISPQYQFDKTILITRDNVIYKSSDGGEHWSIFGNPVGNPITSIRLSPGYPDDQTLIVVTSHNEVIQSNNNAVIWNIIQEPETTVEEIIFSPNYPSDHTIFSSGGYLYISENSGESWVLSPTPEVGGTMEISPNYAEDHTMFWGIKSSSSGRLYKSTNSGQSWTKINELQTYMQSIAVSPKFAQDQTLIICGRNSYPVISEDGGTTWFYMVTGYGFDDLGIAYDNGLATFLAGGMPIYYYDWPELTSISPINLIVPAGSVNPIEGSINLQNKDQAPFQWSLNGLLPSWLTIYDSQGVYPDQLDFTVDPTGLTGSNKAQIDLDVFFSKKQKTTVTVPISLLVYTDQIWLPQLIR